MKRIGVDDKMAATSNKGVVTMPIESKKQSEAKQEWMKKNSKVFGVRVMKITEPDLWNFLQGKEASTVFKTALREYMKNHKEETK